MVKLQQMMIAAKKSLLLVAIGIAGVPAAFAQESPLAVMQYDLDLRLTYIDELQNYNADSSTSPLPAELREERNRAPGLTRFRAVLRWDLPSDSRLNVVLRPDALLPQDEGEDDQVAHEFDSRSGRVYRQASEIHLLDAYQISKLIGESLEIGVGVWEELVENHMSYAPVLEFGLQARYLERFSALRISWKSFGFTPPTAQHSPISGYVVDLYATQGRGERSEVRGSSAETFDKAPSTNDSQYGFAVGLSRVDTTVNRFGVVVGANDSNFIAKKTTGTADPIEFKGKRNEIFAQLYNETVLRFPILSTKVSLDLRYAKEKWKSDDFSIDSRIQQSGSLTTSIEILPESWLALGFHTGRSDLDDDISQDGYQIDYGFVLKPAKLLDLTILASDEHRDMDENGKTHGAFVSADKDKSIVRRFAIDLRYALGQVK